MKNHKHIHCLFALLVSLSGFLIYLRTVAPTTSLWDCGEFIACSYILGVPHPPGAPLYLLLGRLFTMIPFAKDIGLRVNMISVIASTFTVLFTYLIIVRLIKTWRSTPKTGGDWLILYLSGMVGALVFAFTDSQWFNAVEAEVYAISMFFTSAVVWLIMVWAEKSDHPTSDRYLVMIGYCIGLAIGVHLLNILTLPFVFLIIYFKKFKIQSIWKFMASGLLGLITLLGLMAAGGFFKLSILGLLIHIGIHYYYLKKQSREEKEQHPYFRLALTMGIGFLIFLTIYPGIIKGIPVLTNQYGFGILGLTILVLMGLIIFSMIYRKRTWLLASMILFLMIMGYSTYTTIFIRSGMDPAIDENDPETTERMVKYLNREQYGSWSVLPRRYPNIPRKLEFQKRFPQKSYAFHDFSKQMRFFWNYQLKKMYIRYFGWQFIGKGKELDDDGNIKANLSLFGLYGLPFLIGLLGMIYHFSRDWKRAFSILSLFIMTGLAIVVYLNQPDPQPRERDYVYVASFFAFSLWIGIGSASLLDKINHGLETHRPLKHTIMVLLSLLLLGLIPLVLMTNFNSHNRKGNWMATNFAENLLNTCEPNSILFTNGDNDTFPLWFVQEVNNVRKDIRVVNLSLLNTDWYIKQLRDIPPEIPIHLKDETIDKIRLIPWKEKNVIIRVPEAVRNRIEESVPLKERGILDSALVLEIKPTLQFGNTGALQIRDQLILRILQINVWKRPVYFATTIPYDSRLGLDPYLRTDGLALKLMPYRVNHIDPALLKKNLLEIYQYRGLQNPNVYLNHDHIRLLQNFRIGFLTLAEYYLNRNQKKEAAVVLQGMSQKIPESHVPYFNEWIALYFSKLFLKAGLPSNEKERSQNVLVGRNGLGRKALMNLAVEYAQSFENYHLSEEILDILLQKYPDDRQALLTLTHIHESAGQINRAVMRLTEWIKQHPDDQLAQSRLSKLLEQRDLDSGNIP